MAKSFDNDDNLESPPDQHFINDRRGENKIYPQLLAATVGNLTAVVTGCVIGWTSPCLPYLESPKSHIPITKVQNSWISSLMPLAAALGPFAAGYLADKSGRKKTLLLSSLPAVVSWLSLAFADSVGTIYFGRFVGGFTVGWIFTVLPMYCAEIADKYVRGALGSLMQIFIVFGLLFDYCIGPYIPYVWLSISAAVIPLVFVLSFIWMPETPHYLLAVEKFEDAEKSLKWLRGKSAEEVSQELRDIQTSVEIAKRESGRFKDLFATRGTTTALIISFGLMVFQQLSGINVVLFNAQSIFEKVGGSLQPEISAIITGVIMLVASAVTPFVVDRLGRKILLLISASGMALAQAVLGFCFFLEKEQTDMSNFSFLPVLAVVVYIIVYCLGFGPLPWAVMAEMFPANIKSLAFTLTASFCWILGFLVTRFFNELVESIGNDYIFWMFGAFCILAVPFLCFILPETKGKTLTEIQELLSGKTS